MENSLFPGYIDIAYHSDKAPHHQTIPTREWNVGIGTNGAGGFVAWDDSPVDTVDMLTALLVVLKPLFPAEVTLDKWTVWQMASPDAAPIPVASGVFSGGVGTMGTPGWFYAVQATLTFYDTEFSTGKFVLLDCGSSNGFGPRNIGSLTGAQSDLVEQLTLPSNAYASRNGARLGTLRSYRFDLNDKLMRQYYS